MLECARKMQSKTVVEALASVASYNGWGPTIHKLRKYIESEIEKPHDTPFWNIPFPSNILHKYDADLYPRIIWFILVEMYGECGTSPNVGWIEGKTSYGALLWITELCVLCDAYSGDCDE